MQLPPPKSLWQVNVLKHLSLAHYYCDEKTYPADKGDNKKRSKGIREKGATFNVQYARSLNAVERRSHAIALGRKLAGEGLCPSRDIEMLIGPQSIVSKLVSAR